MTYVPYDGGRYDPVSMFVGPYSREGCLSGMPPSSPASAALAAQTAYAAQVVLPRPCVVRRLWWANGATVGTDQVQVGIYRADFTSLLLGTATTTSGATALQFDNVTDTPLAAGRYWVALWVSGTTTTLLRVSALASRIAGIRLQGSLAGGLPATLAAPDQGATTIIAVPVFGFTTRATP